MSIPCKVIVLTPGTVDVGHPGYALQPMKIVPAKYGVQQLMRKCDDNRPDVFRLSYADSGSAVQADRYTFTLSLYADKACSDFVGVAAGVIDGTNLSFTPSSDMVSKPGTFFYRVSVANSSGDSAVLIEDSYVIKK